MLMTGALRGQFTLEKDRQLEVVFPGGIWGLGMI